MVEELSAVTRPLDFEPFGRAKPVFCRTPRLSPFAEDDVTLREGSAEVVTILGTLVTSGLWAERDS